MGRIQRSARSVELALRRQMRRGPTSWARADRRSAHGAGFRGQSQIRKKFTLRITSQAEIQCRERSITRCSCCLQQCRLSWPGDDAVSHAGIDGLTC
jgi:hypothetical protein